MNEIELHKRIKDLEDKIQKDQEQSQQTNAGLKQKLQDIDNQLYDLKSQMQQQQSDNAMQQYIIDRIFKEQINFKKYIEQLQEELDNTKTQANLQISRSVINTNNQGSQQVDQQIYQELENQIKKDKEDIKKVKDDLNNKIKALEDKLDNPLKDLENQEKHCDKEHQWFLESRIEILELQKTIKQKDEKITQLENQSSNCLDTLRYVNLDKLRLEDELNNTKKELENSLKQNDKQHQWFLESIDEILKLKKIIKQKDDKIKQLDNQQSNFLDTLKQIFMDKQRLEEKINVKDLDITALREEIKLLKEQTNLLKQLLYDSSKGKKINIDQNQQYQQLVQQQNQLIDKRQREEELLNREHQQREQERKDKIEKERKKKVEARILYEKNIGNQLKQGNQIMQLAKIEFGQLDVCFIVDVTASMDKYKEQTKRSVQGSLKFIRQATNRETNWASVCYQDKAELKQLGKYYEFPFSKDYKALEKWFDGIKCSGGGDSAEDIKGAIKQVCKLNWPSRFRIAIIICDAPCHGSKYNGGGDDYPDEDIQDAIEELIEKNIVLLALNFKSCTRSMYEEIKKIYKSKQKLDLFLYQDLQQINQDQMSIQLINYLSEASQNATFTNKNQTKSKQEVVQQQEIPREKEGAMEALCKQGNFYKFEEQENVKTIPTKFEVWSVELKDEAFNNNIDTIEKIQCPQDFSKNNEGSWDCIRTEKPFAFGMMKDVFLMKKLNETEELYVIKTPIGSQPYKTMDDALKECKSHLICQKLMKKFVNELQEQNVEKKKSLQIPKAIYNDLLILEESKNSFLIAERFFKGDFVKYNNNYGFIHEDHQLELNKFAQSFTYYTYFISNFNYMVCDVQGVGNYFTDPIINTQKGNFDDTDMGQEGQMMYLVNYQNKKALLTYEYLDLLGIYE